MVRPAQDESSELGQLPLPIHLTRMLSEAQLLEDIKEWDQLEIDVLCLHLIKSPFEKMIKRYPKLSSKKLQRLKILLEGGKP